MKETNVERSDTEIDQRIKEHLVNLKFRFSNYFALAVSDKYKWITDPFHADSPRNLNFFLEKEEEEEEEDY
jgi:hypothetical protein